MDKIAKFLLRLSVSELEAVLFILEKIKVLEIESLDVKKIV
jgi:hypothetical protein